MALTAAERQQRSRAHKRGDHKLCDPARCPDVTPLVTDVTSGNVTEEATDPVLAELGARGRRLYREVLDEHRNLGARERVVLEEAARTADRCERLDRLLSGDIEFWARVEVAGTRYSLYIDKTMAEARQQQATLARLLSELRQHLAPAAKEAPAAPPPAPTKGSGIADLTARIRARQSAPTG